MPGSALQKGTLGRLSAPSPDYRTRRRVRPGAVFIYLFKAPMKLAIGTSMASFV